MLFEATRNTTALHTQKAVKFVEKQTRHDKTDRRKEVYIFKFIFKSPLFVSPSTNCNINEFIEHYRFLPLATLEITSALPVHITCFF